MPSLAIVKEKVAAADAQQGAGGSLIRKVDASARAMIKKRVNPNQPWQVILVGDKSYSMSGQWGNVQDAVERTLGFAVIADDDGSVPAVFFGGNIKKYTVRLSDFHGFVERERIRPDGGTPLAEALREVAEITGNGDLFGRSSPQVRKMATPAFATIVTDGAPNDRRAATRAVQLLSYRAVFLKFLFVGDVNDRDARRGWEYLEALDDDIPVGVPFERGGRLIDNVDSKNMGELHGVTDEVFYEAMYDEVMPWLENARANGLL